MTSNNPTEYNLDMVAKIKVAASGRGRPVCCDRFPDCDCTWPIIVPNGWAGIPPPAQNCKVPEYILATSNEYAKAIYGWWGKARHTLQRVKT